MILLWKDSHEPLKEKTMHATAILLTDACKIAHAEQTARGVPEFVDEPDVQYVSTSDGQRALTGFLWAVALEVAAGLGLYGLSHLVRILL